MLAGSMKTEQIDKPTCQKIIRFLSAFTHTREQYWQSYSSWARGGNGWQRRLSFFGGTNIMQVLMWYQHIHRPGSKEWRPGIIIQALLAQIAKEEING